MIADACFSKKKVVDTMLILGLHFTNRLGEDAVMRYIYQGEPTGKKGRPKMYDGKVNAYNLNRYNFTEIFSDKEMKIYSANVYCKALKRDIKLAVTIYYKDGKEGNQKNVFFN